MGAELDRLRALLGSQKPERVTQAAFDFDDQHLMRLVGLGLHEPASGGDLYEYTQDLLYVNEIQAELFTYLLPVCLRAWREHLRGAGIGYVGFVENFYPVLAHPRVRDVLDPEQCAAISTYMSRTLLEEIDEQRGLSYRGMGARPYRWVRALTTHGVLFSDIEQVWTDWWSIGSVGRAIAAAQYLSCMMYANAENPIFAAWTPDAGGGPPCLWEYAGHLYAHCWLEPNVAFLKRSLVPRQLEQRLERVVETLEGKPEHEVAAAMLEDVPLCAETLGARCEELPHLLATVQRVDTLLEWTL